MLVTQHKTSSPWLSHNQYQSYSGFNIAPVEINLIDLTYVIICHTFHLSI